MSDKVPEYAELSASLGLGFYLSLSHSFRVSTELGFNWRYLPRASDSDYNNPLNNLDTSEHEIVLYQRQRFRMSGKERRGGTILSFVPRVGSMA